MSFSSRGTGWKPDTEPLIQATAKLSRAGHRDRFGVAPLPREAKGLMPFCYVRDQLESSACTGFAFTGAVYARLHAIGIPCELFSPLNTYAVGRQLDGSREPLPDDGAYPFYVVDGCRKYGMAPERVLPFDVATYKRIVQKEADFGTFQQASQFRISNYARIVGDPEDIHLATMQAVAGLIPVPTGMQIGQQFLRYTKGRGPVDVENDNEGGHMTFIVGYEDNGEILIGCNSWSKDYGDEGFYRITKAKYLSNQTSDRYSFTVSEAA